MHSLTCSIRDFNAAADTCTVEVQGIGIVDAWIDGVAIAPTVDRSFIVAGAPGVITVPDINRPCDATLIQVTPPGDPVSYDPDQIVTYTGSLLVDTDITGAGCQDVTFPTPYSSVPVVNASAAHPAAVTISNVTETGFTACVTGGRVSSKHAVSYSSKSTKTSTATKNKALTVDHNEVEVGTHYILDFKDDDVVFTVESKDTPARNQVTATLSDAFKAGLGSASRGAFPYVEMQFDPGNTTTLTVPTGLAGLPIAWDTAIVNDYGLWDPATPTDFVAKEAGLYHVDAQINWLASSAGVRFTKIVVNGVPFVDPTTVGTSADKAKAGVSGDVHMQIGDVLTIVGAQTTGADLAIDYAQMAAYLVQGASTGTATRVSSAADLPLSASPQTISWDTTDTATPSTMHDATGQPTRLVAPADDHYLIAGRIVYAPGGATNVSVQLTKNGTDLLSTFDAAADPWVDVQDLQLLLKDDYIEAAVTFSGVGATPSLTGGTTQSHLVLASVGGGGDASGAGVASLDGLSGDVGLLAGSGIAVTILGQNLTIDNTAAAAALPSGGTTGQILAKASDSDYDTTWVDETGGTGSGVDSLNTQTGDITLSAGTGIGVATVGTTITISNTDPGSPYTLPDATTTSTGGVEIDHPAVGTHPVALTENSQGHIYTAQLPAGSVDVDPTLTGGDLLYHHDVTTAVIGFIGDSITEHVPTGGNNPPTNVAADLTTGSLAVTVNNQGISGTTSNDWTPTALTGYYAAALASFLAAGVTVCHIMLGTNDSDTANRISQATYTSNLAAICADLAAHGIVAVLSYSPYCVPGSGGGLYDATALTFLLQYQAAIDGLVNGTSIRQGDVEAYSYFQAHTSELADGVHPTATGSVDLAQLWANALAPILTAPLARLPLGAAGQVLTSTGTQPTWQTPPIATAWGPLCTGDAAPTLIGVGDGQPLMVQIV